MIDAFSDMQRLSQTNVDSALRAWGDWNRNWQALTSEVGAYQRRSMEDGAATLHKLMSAKSLEQAFEIHSTYARQAYQQYFEEVNKIGGLYAGMAKEALGPLTRLSQANWSH